MKPPFLASIAAFILTLPAHGQQSSRPEGQTGQAAKDPVVRIFVNLVQVDAVVTDRNGRQVTDLKPEDFEILQDGRRQKISNFSYIAVQVPPKAVTMPQPAVKGAVPPPPTRLRPQETQRTIALVVDDLGLSFASTADVRDALKKFVDERMQPGDLVAIIRTGAGIGALQQFTADKRHLYASIERIRWNPIGRGRISAFAPISFDPAARAEEETALDRVEELREEIFSVGTLGAINFVIRGLKELPGRKSVVLLSDGFRIFNQEGDNTRILDSLRRLTDLANRASVVIYTIDTRGLQTLSLSAEDNVAGMSDAGVRASLENRRSQFFDTQDGLNYLAQETGGFFIHNTNDIGDGIGRVLDDQKGYYLLGYVPDAATFESKAGRQRFHKIAVKVKVPGLQVRSRTGFFGVEDESAPVPPRTRQQQLLTAVTRPFGSDDIPLRLTSLFGHDQRVGPIVRSLLHVDAGKLSFTEEADGWHKTVLDLLALTFGDNGDVVDEFNRTFTIRTRGEDYRRTLQGGLICTLNVPVKKAGAYQLRTAVRDAGTQRVGSASQFIEVPDLGKGRLALSGIVLRGSSPKPETAASAGSTPPSAETEPAEGHVAEPDLQASPAVRRFRPGTRLDYGLVIYNAQIERATGRPQLNTQVRLFREGREV